MAPRIAADGGDPARGPSLAAVVKLLQERAQTLNELAERAMMFYGDVAPKAELLAEHVTDAVKPALHALAERFATVDPWEEAGIQSAFEGALKAHGLKMPKLAMPLRAVVFGTHADAVALPDARAGGEGARARAVAALRLGAAESGFPLHPLDPPI